jgi:hypothetical protein
MLFNINDIDENPVESKLCHAMDISSFASHTLMATKSFATLESSLPDLSHNCIFNLMSDGKWSMVHLLLKILKQTGPADLYATTWSTNEDAIKQLIEMRENGLLRTLHFLFDFRVRKYRPAAYFMAKENFVSRIASCHAKVTVITNDSWNVTIVGSPNYTRNDRIEAAVLFENKPIADFHKDWIIKTITNANADI